MVKGRHLGLQSPLNETPDVVSMKLLIFQAVSGKEFYNKRHKLQP